MGDIKDNRNTRSSPNETSVLTRSAYDSLVSEIEKDGGMKINIQEEGEYNLEYYIVFPRANSVYRTDPRLEVLPDRCQFCPTRLKSDENDVRIRRAMDRPMTALAKATKKDLKMTFNETLPDCTSNSLPCSSLSKIPVVVASLVVYANDKRRFDFSNTSALSSIPKEGSTNDNKISQLLIEKYPDLLGPGDTKITLDRFKSSDILLEYFHDTDEDTLLLPIEAVSNATRNFTQTQGIIHELTLSMFYEKKFNRCPERYFMNSFFLGVYMLAANIMLVNLLVALFATTYEKVQENSENIWKLNRYDLVIEYWGKGPLPTPLVLIEHIFLLFKMLIFCRNPRQNQIVCWARSPGDHALHIQQFPIKNFNDEGSLDRRIRDLIKFEEESLKACAGEDQSEEEEDHALKCVKNQIEDLKNDIRLLTGNLQNVVELTK